VFLNKNSVQITINLSQKTKTYLQGSKRR